MMAQSISDLGNLTRGRFLAALGGAPWKLSVGTVVALIQANQLSNVDTFLVQHPTGVRFALGDRHCWVELRATDLQARADALDRLDSYDRAPTWIIDHDGGYVALWQLDAAAPLADREAVNRKLAAALGSTPPTDHTAPLPGSGSAKVVDRSTARAAFEQPKPYALDKLIVTRRRRIDPKVAAEAAEKAKCDQEALLDEMNAKHCVLTQEAGKTRVLSWERSELDASRESPVLQSFDCFRNRYCHRVVQVPTARDVKNIPLGTWYLQHPQRREYLALRFDPDAGEVIDGGYLNLWRGFGVEPREGDWSLMRAHIQDVLAAGDEASAQYILRWCAWAVQHPGEPAEVALVLKGGKGTGKGVFCRAIKSLFGHHGMQVTSPMQLTGRFNAHLRDCCLLFADEAVAASDKATESVLKGLITEPELAIEGKGVNVVMARNRLHVLMASNDAWVVPATADERRYGVFEVSNDRAQSHAYFKALVSELDSGGLAAMLHDLRALDLGDWHPRRNIPQTSALAEQKMRSLRGADSHVRGMLESGTDHGWCRSEGDRVFVATRLCCKALGLSARDETALGRSLAKASRDSRPDRIVANGGRYSGYWLPALPEARARWAKAMRIPVQWPADGAQQWEHAGETDEGRAF